ncbi:unnamed protein product [Chrysoparadoxa australica]
MVDDRDSRSASPDNEMVEVPPPLVVQRSKVCPMLMRVFWRLHSHHVPADYQLGRLPKQQEVSLYVWFDTTLREISSMFQDAVPEARRRNSRCTFCVVYPDKQGNQLFKQVGCVRQMEKGEDDGKTLKELNYSAGDYVDVAVHHN